MNMKVDGNSFALDKIIAGEVPQNPTKEISRKPVDASQTFAGIVTNKMLDSLLGPGAAVTLRHPDSAASMPVNDLHAEVEKLLAHPDLLQGLARLADDQDVKDSKNIFDISKLSSSNIFAIFAGLIKALQDIKTAENQNKSDMAIVKGKMTDGAAQALRASGDAALSGALSQAVLGGAISGAGFAMQQKGIGRERAMLKHDRPNILKQQQSVDSARLNISKGGSSALDSATGAQPSRLNVTEGQNIPMKPGNKQVGDKHQAHIEDGADIIAKQKSIGDHKQDIQLKQTQVESTKAKGMLISQMGHPTMGIAAGQTQAIQASANAQQHTLQQVGHAADGMADSSNANARDFESLIQTIAQKLADIIRAHSDTASMIAGKSV